MSDREGTIDHRPTKAPRVLACVLCQQRKVKCNRQFPCSNCIKSRAQCVPATLLPRRPRRKLPERDLLDRLHKYEDLLRKHNIDFESKDDATPTSAKSAVSPSDNELDEDADEPSPADTVNSTASISTVRRNFWHAMRVRVRINPIFDTDSTGLTPKTVPGPISWTFRTWFGPVAFRRCS